MICEQVADIGLHTKEKQAMAKYVGRTNYIRHIG
jgi:hypothetical protein